MIRPSTSSRFTISHPFSDPRNIGLEFKEENEMWLSKDWVKMFNRKFPLMEEVTNGITEEAVWHTQDGI